MAESTLSITISELKKRVGQFLGYDRDPSGWPTDQSDRVDEILISGLRQFYWPPPLPGERNAHEWYFLRYQPNSIVLSAPYSDGTITLSNGDATVTLSGGTWPSWAGSGQLIVDGVDYEIDSRTDDTNIELVKAWDGSNESGKTYSLVQSNYELPADFGSISGPLTYADSTHRWGPVILVGEGRIRQEREKGYYSFRPFLAAIRPKLHTDGTTGQRFEIMFYPYPDDNHHLQYAYSPLPDKLVSSTRDYPLGGAQHSETIRESCLAIAESEIEDSTSQVHQVRFMQCLRASVAIDRQGKAAERFGYNRDHSDDTEFQHPFAAVRHPRSENSVTFDGVLY